MKIKKGRIWELDFLRGFAIICMIFDHIMFDFSDMFYFGSGTLAPISEFAVFYMNHWLRAPIQTAFVILFVMLSGISSSFTRSNLKRGIKLGIVALLVTAVSLGVEYFAQAESAIWFGILHMLAASILLYALIGRFGNIVVGSIGAVMVVAGWLIEFLGVRVSADWLMPFGIYSSGFVSADYYPLLPWTGFFLLGAVVGTGLYGERKSLLPSQQEKKWHTPFRFVGKHSLGVYVLHQPIVWGIITLIAFLLGYEINLF